MIKRVLKKSKRMLYLSAALILATACMSVLVVTEATHAQPEEQNFRNVVLFATDSIELKEGSVIQSGGPRSVGDIIVNDAGPGPTMELKVGVRVSTAAGSNLIADSIRIQNRATVAGSVYYNELDSKETIGGSMNSPVTLPIFGSGEIPAFMDAIPDDNNDISVKQNESVSIPPGNYGKIDIKKGGSLVLGSTGIYNIRTIQAGPDTSVLVNAADEVDVRVAEDFTTGHNFIMRPVSGASIDASDIIFYVAGEIPGGKGTPIVDIGERSTISATMYLKAGRLVLRNGTNASGAFFATDIDVGVGTTVTYNSYFGNEPPVAVDDAYTTDEDINLVVPAPGVLGNDFDADGDPLTALQVSGPVQGTLILNNDGSFTYTPNANYYGPDSFTYKANDGTADSNTATVSLTVNPVNDAPTEILLSNNTVNENTSGAVIGNLSVTDPDIGDSHTFSVVDARFEVVGNQLKLKAGESLDYETEATVSLDITATDSGSLSYTESFIITVNNVNEVPTDIWHDNNTVNENTSGAVIGNLSVTDPDIGDSHTYSVDDARFEVIGSQLKLKAGESLDYETEATVSLDITATDSGSLSYSESFIITVNDANDAPSAADDAYDTIGNTLLEVSGTPTVAAAVHVAGNLLDNDIDPEGDPMTATVNATTLGAVVIINADGTFTYTPPPGATGTDTFTYDVTDGSLTVTGTVTITILEKVWYVDNTASAGGKGTSSDPFNTLAEAEAAARTDDIIFIFTGSGVTGQDKGIMLKDNQQLIGEGVALDIDVDVNGNAAPTIIAAAGSRPTIANTAGDGITLALDNTIRGLNISDTTGGDGIYGTTSGDVTVNEVSISGAGGLVNIDGATLHINFSSLESTGGDDVAINLNKTGGTFAVDNGSGTDTNISDAATAGIDIRNSAAGAAYSFGDTEVSGAEGVLLDTNPSTIFTFETLDITATAGTGLLAHDSGTVNATIQPTITATGGPAINVDNTAGNVGGGSQWSFDGPTSLNSPDDGIIFTNVGQSINLNDIVSANATDNGIELINITGPTVTITGGSIDGLASDGHGIYLDGVTGTTTVQGTGPGSELTIVNIGTGSATGHSAIRAVNSGDLVVQYVDISTVGQSGDEHGISIKDPITGNRAIDITENIFAEIGDASDVGAGSAIDLEVTEAAAYTGVLDIDVTSNDINGDDSGFNTTNQGVNLDFSAGALGSLDANISLNDIDGVREGIAVIIQGDTGSGGTRNVININDNTVVDVDNNGIEVDVTDDIFGDGSSNTRAIINGNQLTAISAYTGGGHDPDQAIEVQARGTGSPILSADITNNDISGNADTPGERWDGDGISVGSAGTGTFAGTLYFDVEDNNISHVEDAGIYVDADENATVNARIIGNTLEDTAGNGIEIEFENTDPATINLYLKNNEVGAGNIYDIETAVALALAIGSDPGTSGTYSGIDTLVDVLNDSGNTVGGADVTATDVENPPPPPDGPVDYNVVVPDSTPEAN
ncbi:Ig-like domain-containing protein [Chloroflexota bacterium]